MTCLAVAIDHIATLRQVRGGKEPDPVQAAVLAELAGARCISARLREDRRHLQERDIYLLKQVLSCRFNLVIPPIQDLEQLALDVVPHMVTFIPGQSEGEGAHQGLAIAGNEKHFAHLTEKFHEHSIRVCFFVDPHQNQIRAAKKVGATNIELNTAHFAQALGHARFDALEELKDAALLIAQKYGIPVSAGGELGYATVSPVAAIANIDYVTIGHALISRAVMSGLDKAVRDMIALLN